MNCKFYLTMLTYPTSLLKKKKDSASDLNIEIGHDVYEEMLVIMLYGNRLAIWTDGYHVNRHFKVYS